MGDLQHISGSLLAGRFELESIIGRGGMGTVYRARDLYSGELVAIKFLLPGAAERARDGERFMRETQLLSELRHPGIVSYVAHGQTLDGALFLAMEWLDGESLAQRLLRGPLPLRACLHMFERIADALAYAHQQGVMHRDLKPSNLYLVGHQLAQVKLIDFGVARRVSGEQLLTQSGAPVGTPEYMAPEQVRAEAALTPAVDLFSLGCVLYECLTGQSPFAADTLAAVLTRVLLEEPPPLDERRPGVPGTVSSLLGRLLAKDPAQRLASGGALRSELASLGDLPEPAHAGTLPRSRLVAGGFAEHEQSLLSVVLAVLPERAEALFEPPWRPSFAEPQSMLRALDALGVEVDALADGTLAVVAAASGSAVEQATRAARAALLIRELWPTAATALATGRGSVQGQRAAGEVLEAATRLLSQMRQGVPDGQCRGVFIDSLSARLLAGRFAQLPQPGGAMLLGEERQADASQPLLGKPTPCVGRDRELAVMESQLIDTIEESEARALLLTAAPGVGKSRLRYEFLRGLEKRGAAITCLAGSSDLMSPGKPYGVLRSAIHQLCGIRGREPLHEQQERFAARIRRHVATAEQPRVELFLGELCKLVPQDSADPLLRAARQEPEIMRGRLRRALLDWLAAECRAAPVLIVIDDLQWSDALTVAALDDVLRELHGAPLFVLAFARPEVHELFPKLWHGHRLQEVFLKGLGKRACERLMREVLGSAPTPEQVAQTVEQSGGNALLLEELIRPLAERAPAPSEVRPGPEQATAQLDTVLAMLQARIERLSPGARRAVRAAAVFGRTFWRGGVATLLGLAKTSADTDRALAVLEEEELIQSCPSSRLSDEREYRFRHAFVREAAYQLLSPSDQKIGHGLAGQYLELMGERDATALAEHAQRAGQLDRAVVFYAAAAEQCYDCFDTHGVLAWTGRGLAGGASGATRGLLLGLQFMAEFWRGNMLRALPLGLEAIDLLPSGGLWWCRTMALLFTAASHCGDAAALTALIERFAAAEAAPDSWGAYATAGTGVTLMFSLLGLREPAQRFLRRTERAAEAAGASDLNAQGGLKTAQGWYLRMLEPDPVAARDAAIQGAQLYARAGNQRHQCMAMLCLGMSLAELGDPGAGSDTLRQLLEEPWVQRDGMVTANVRAYLALILVRSEKEGLLDEACSLAEQVITAGISPVYTGVARTVLAHAALLRGQPGAAEAEARQAAALTQPLPPCQLDAQVVLIHALLRQRQLVAARSLAEAALQSLRAMGGLGYAEVPLRLAVAEARWADGELAGARDALGDTCRQIQLRGDRIADADWRHRFATQVPAHARARALAEIWSREE